MAPASLASGIVPCVIGVCAGTPKLGAFGVGSVVRSGKGVGPPPQREQRYPGRRAPSSGPPFSHAPTFHLPRPNKRKQVDSASPQLNALPQVVEVLKMLVQSR